MAKQHNILLRKLTALDKALDRLAKNLREVRQLLQQQRQPEPEITEAEVKKYLLSIPEETVAAIKREVAEEMARLRAQQG